jgi:RNA polymerase sigma-70 factor (ECF subfamily)
MGGSTHRALRQGRAGGFNRPAGARGHTRMMTDEQLLRAFIGGDDDALRTLALRHEPMLLSVARGLLSGDQELARDVVQDAWTKVIARAATFRGDAMVRTWLVRIVMNCARDARRRARVRSRTMEGFRARAVALAGTGAPTGEPGEAGDIASDHNGSRRLALEDQEIIALALAQLPDPLRECVVLCVGRGMTHQEAAAVLGWPIGTLKTRLTRAMKALQSAAKEFSGHGE